MHDITIIKLLGKTSIIIYHQMLCRYCTHVSSASHQNETSRRRSFSHLQPGLWRMGFLDAAKNGTIFSRNCKIIFKLIF